MGPPGLLNAIRSFGTSYPDWKSYRNYLAIILDKDEIKCAIDGASTTYILKRAHGNKYPQILTNMLSSVVRAGIYPIICFDGKKISPEKEAEIKKRQESRLINFQKLVEAKKNDEEAKVAQLSKRMNRINDKDVSNVDEVCSKLGIQMYICDGEADSVCAKLCELGFCDFVLSSDMDILVYGSPRLATYIKIDKRNYITEFTLDTILTKYNLTRDQFIDMCILMGSQFMKLSKKIKFKEAITLICENKCIEKIWEDKNYSFLKQDLLELDKTRKIYKNNELIDFKRNIEPINVKKIRHDVFKNKFNRYDWNVRQSVSKFRC